MKYKINNQEIILKTIDAGKENRDMKEHITRDLFEYVTKTLINDYNQLIKALGTPVEETITKARFYSKLTGKCLGIRDTKAELDENETWEDNKCSNCSKIGQRGVVVSVTYDNLCTECNAEVNLKSFEAFNVVRKKELTIEERKALLEIGWEEQENYKFTNYNDNYSYTEDLLYGVYVEKQKAIAKLNTVIDKLNKEQGWEEDWSDADKRKYTIFYSYIKKYMTKDFTWNNKQPLNIHYMSEETAYFLLENYKEELETLFEVK